MTPGAKRVGVFLLKHLLIDGFVLSIGQPHTKEKTLNKWKALTPTNKPSSSQTKQKQGSGWKLECWNKSLLGWDNSVKVFEGGSLFKTLYINARR